MLIPEKDRSNLQSGVLLKNKKRIPHHRLGQEFFYLLQIKFIWLVQMMETQYPVFLFCLLAGKNNLSIIHRLIFVEIILTCCLIGSRQIYGSVFFIASREMIDLI